MNRSKSRSTKSNNLQLPICKLPRTTAYRNDAIPPDSQCKLKLYANAIYFLYMAVPLSDSTQILFSLKYFINNNNSKRYDDKGVVLVGGGQYYRDTSMNINWDWRIPIKEQYWMVISIEKPLLLLIGGRRRHQLKPTVDTRHQTIIARRRRQFPTEYFQHFVSTELHSKHDNNNVIEYKLVNTCML